MKIKKFTGEDIHALRKTSGLNQSDFWRNFQVTQSCGCRYETGREIPGPVQLLLTIAFGTEVASAAAVGELKDLKDHAKASKKSKNSMKIPLGFGMLP